MMPPETAAQGTPIAATGEVSEFEKLLTSAIKVKPDDIQKQTAVQSAVRTLAQQALSSTKLISSDVTKTISAIIAEIDRKLSEQINLIIHHEDYKALEGSWRGLSHLVNNTETDETLKIRVLNISKNEVKKTLKKFEGTAWDQSPLFKKLYGEEFDSSWRPALRCFDRRLSLRSFARGCQDRWPILPRFPLPCMRHLSRALRRVFLAWKLGRN